MTSLVKAIGPDSGVNLGPPKIRGSLVSVEVVSPGIEGNGCM